MNKQLLSLTPVLYFVLALSSITATGKTWTNTVNGLWTDAASWDPIGVPGASDDVIIPQAVVTIPTTATVQSLTINGTGFLKIAAQGDTDPAVQTPLDANSTTPIALTVSGNLTLAGSGKLSVGGLNQNANGTLSVGGDLTLTNTAKLAVYAGPTNETAAIETGGSWVTVTGNTTLGTGSWIIPICDQRSGAAVFFDMQDVSIATDAGFNADARGFGRVDGYPLAPGAGTSYPVGGSYGGRGGYGSNTPPAPTYGNIKTPFLPGAPSGFYNNYGAGGGAIRIIARDILLNGILRANVPGRTFGGASGGSVWLTCRTLEGNGRINAIGGTCTAGYGSDGGGGRIALDVENEVTDPSACNVAVSARQGINHTGRKAEVGTLYVNKLSVFRALLPTLEGARVYCPELENASISLPAVSIPAKTHILLNELVDTLTFTGGVTVAADALLGFGAIGTPWGGFRPAYTNAGEQAIIVDENLDVSGTFVLGGDGTAARTVLTVSNDLTVTSEGKLFAYAAPTNATTTFQSGGARVNVGDTLTVGANSWVYPWCDIVYGTPVVFAISNLAVEANGGFNANAAGFGYRDGVTLAPGKGGSYTRGGGYGGYGGGYNATDGQIYGVAYAPILPGSPNGIYQTHKPFRGGGAIHIHATGNANLLGSFTANGNDVALSAYSGPSGGSIWITAKRFTYGDNLTLEAKGGWSGWDSGGGGGRIALGADVNNFLDDFYAETLPSAVTLETLSLDGIDISGVNSGTDGTAVIVAGPFADKSLTVISSPVNAGMPTPAYGVSTYAHGSVVTCSVPSPGLDLAYNGRSRLSCSGYVVSNATEEVVSGTGLSVDLTLDENLTLTWLWGDREHRFDTVAGSNGTLTVNSGTVSSYSEWVGVGEQATTVTAVGDSGHAFVAWAGDVPYSLVDTPGVAPFMDVPRTMTAYFAPTTGTTRQWQGGTGVWFDPANWEPIGIPALGDTVTIASGTCILTNYAAVASLTLQNSAILRVGGLTGSSAAAANQLPITDLAMGEAGLQINEDLTITSGAQLGIGGLNSDYISYLKVGGNLSLSDSGKLAVFSGPTNELFTFQTGGAQVTVDGSFSIATNAWVYPTCHRVYGAPVRFDIGAALNVAAGGGFDAVQRGYGMRVTGEHPAVTILSLGPGAGSSYSIGGGYGGYGGDHTASRGNPYGSAYAPFRPGSPSGYYYSASTFPVCYGIGGGALNLHCNRAVINGTLLADGASQAYPYGGSSGGGIWLTTSSKRLTIGPTAVLQAAGGESNYNSAGGGGRIAIGIGLSDEQLDQAYTDEVMPNGTVEWTPEEIGTTFPDVVFSVTAPNRAGSPGDNATDGTVTVYKSRPFTTVIILR